MALNPFLCPRCGGEMVYTSTYYGDKGMCDMYRCRDCGYSITYCVKTTHSYSGGCGLTREEVIP